MAAKETYFATCGRGIETVLADELRGLGAADIETGNGGVTFSGNQRLLYRANLKLRTATRVLLPLKKFRAKTSDELYQQVREIGWRQYLDPKGTLAVHCKIRGKTRDATPAEQSGRNQGGTEAGLNHSHYVSLKIKDAIVDQLREKLGRRPDVRLIRPDLAIFAFVQGEDCVLSLDSSGESLHRRGYRQTDTPAPLKETLAAALVAFSGWDEKSPLIDPMCGSGTLPLEAGLKAKNIAPGLLRAHFSFFGWKDFSKEIWDDVVAEAKAEVVGSPRISISGFDQQRRAIAGALKNAKAAGLGQTVHFEKRSFSQLQAVGDKPGVLLVNPPYGERLGDEKNLIALYRQLGDLFKQQMHGWRCFIFTGNKTLAKAVGLRTSKRIPLYNGPIECRLLQYDMY